MSSRYIVDKSRQGPESGLCWVVWDSTEKRRVDWCKTKREALRSAKRHEAQQQEASRQSASLGREARAAFFSEFTETPDRDIGPHWDWAAEACCIDRVDDEHRQAYCEGFFGEAAAAR